VLWVLASQRGPRRGGGGSTVSALFVPVDRRLPKIRIQTRQRDVLQDKRILVAVDAWPADSRYPAGHYIKTLGSAGDKEVETEVLLHEYDIPWEPFSEKVMACLPPSDWSMTPENTKGRVDLRKLSVMSIDPPGCKDIDDALHCTPLPNGNFAVGVHIADVSYFVQPGSALDEEAANRSTSTYLVQRRLDMLPKLLTETLCSLTSTSDHFAFSVLWELTPNADIVSVDFCKSIIRSVASLSYQEAQNIHDDPHAQDAVAQGIRGLNSLAKKLRAKRMEAGALMLASTEVKFVLDADSSDPLDVQMYQLKETHALVEEFMLLANITVGKKILRHYPTLSLLRRHPSPSRERFESLIAAAASRGFSLCVDDSSELQQSLDASVDKDDPNINKIIRILATRCMFPAQYFCSGECSQDEWHHYGLAAPIYTHFTSPIRRYADIVVHRLLAASIGVAPLPEALLDKGGMHDLAENMNRRHKAAQNAGRGSTAFHTVLFFKENPVEAEDAYILRILETRLIVLVPRFGIEGTIDLKGLADQGLLNRQADGHRITCPGKVELKVFDKIRVGIRVAEGKAAHRDAVVYTLQSPRIPGLDVEREEGARNVEGGGKKRKSADAKKK
ncbi:exosome complex exonuclease, partial [Nannochloropsis gaditana]